MSSFTVNYDDCSVEELIGALEHVDDENFPQNALEIYNKLTKEKGLTKEEILSYFDAQDWLREFLDLIFAPISSDRLPTKADIEQKVKRIRNHESTGT